MLEDDPSASNESNNSSNNNSNNNNNPSIPDSIRNKSNIMVEYLEGVGARKILDITHNSVIQRPFAKEDQQQLSATDNNSTTSNTTNTNSENETLWLHRKGAAPSDCGPVSTI